MAAVALAMRNLFIRLGFTDDCAQAIVQVQGIDDMHEVVYLYADDVTILCKNLRRPGGQIPNPDADDDDDDVPDVIPNPGHVVARRAENNLKQACYFARHRARISRDCVAADITLPNIRALRSLRLSEKAHKDPTEKPKINHNSWPKTIENILEYLRSVLGETGVPLQYVVRREREVPANDPPGGYPTPTEEMIARAPHFDGAGNPTQTFVADNHKVWEFMHAVTCDDVCFAYVKPSQRARDGRGAYWALFNHYLGPNNVDNMASAAERRLQNMSYSGDGKRWNLEKLITTHVQQHGILHDLEEYGYAGLDERSKVRHLVDAINTPVLEAPKAQVLATPALRGDFEATATLFKDFLMQKKSMEAGNNSRNILPLVLMELTSLTVTILAKSTGV